MSDQSQISAEALDRIARDGVPLVAQLGILTEAVGNGTLRMRMPYQPHVIRPGGTVAGPALFTLADFALFGAVLTLIGPLELTVTTSMTLNFLRRPAPVDVLGEARVLKLGQRLAYGEVMMFSDGETDPVAHATGTYSIPPHRPVSVAVEHYRVDDSGRRNGPA